MTSPSGAHRSPTSPDGEIGLTIEQVFSKPGVHPYDEVQWELRDVVQQNWQTGATVFEQHGVEFPTFWSVNASTIVASKYFRGAVGTPQREHSLRQLIDRVVSTYRQAGEDHGYFASAADAEIFEHELTWLLLHQYFSFNSPVWFNVGTTAPQQVSACFLLAVDDTMDSILNWYREEGLIFKGGSGAGLNLSRIRSSKELLSSGGTASGPVSFMRGADASAGTIKSGGATRRAAKMVILDVDHPDIAEFVETKAREERKIRALRDAGFEMDLGGTDITSVQYQNANNSVRVSDEFMRAVRDGDTFGLRARTTGEVIETVNARELFRSIAQAAWECADPGVQYDDTINDWHTTPDSGRISASNPCFTGDTLVHTDKGLIRFDELIDRSRTGESFGVYTHDATNAEDPTDRVVLTTPRAVMITGRNEVYRLEFSNGMVLRCTANHRVWTTNRGYVEAKDLMPADRILPLNVATPPVAADASFSLRPDAQVSAGDVIPTGHGHSTKLPEKWTPEFAHLLGWLIGDGAVRRGPVDTARRRGNSDGAVWVYGSDDKEPFLRRHQAMLTKITGRLPKPSLQANGTAQLRSYRTALVDFFAALGVTMTGAAHKRIPDAVFQAPLEAQAAFLRGLFDADGTAAETNNGTRYVGLGSVSDELLRDVQRLLSSIGIGGRIYATRRSGPSGFAYTTVDGARHEYDCLDLFDLRISGENVPKFASSIGFDHPRKAARLKEWLTSREFYRTDQSTRLVSREFDGIEVTYNLTEPRNHSYIANGVVVRNCSEYVHLDNSSCNLASINLLKFLAEDGSFESEKFVKAVELVITAMDISICFADFPTEKIAENTRAYRQLGIGYANLGALLMATGHGYDSAGGRSLAASITSLMTGAAYRRSAELAGVVGPYDGYARNAEGHRRVMRKHASAHAAVTPVDAIDGDIHRHATAVWDDGLRLGEENGWRNAQASLLAPTGTIAFMLDCDTTGIEPDFSLVKFKKLVGGGSMQIVNRTVPRALRAFGYPEETIEAIVAYVAERGHVVGAPGLRPEHYEVFDCAVGERAIKPMGHVRMMAAVQPLLSGAISKTVNLPESASVDDIEEVFFRGWKLGLKALAVYRDNCKVGQPLSTGDSAGRSTDQATGASSGSSTGTSSQSASNGTADSERTEAPAPEVVVEYRPTRRRLPKSRPSRTTSFTVGGAEGYMTAGSYPDNGLGEIFLKLGKQGSTLAGVMDAFSIAVSIGLQYGVPLETYVQKFTNLRFDPAGITDDADVRMAQSIMDYIFRRLALDFLPPDQRAALGIYSAAERQQQVEHGASTPEAASEAGTAEAADTGDPASLRQTPIDSHDRDNGVASGVTVPPPAAPHSSPEVVEAFGGTTDAPLCFTCGTKMRPAGSCYVCEGCGSTSGCS